MVRLRWLQLFRGLPIDRGWVAGKPFWLKREVIRWAPKSA